MPNQLTYKTDDNALPKPRSLNDKIRLFEERVWGWQLRVAEQMVNGAPDHQGNGVVGPLDHSGYAALAVVMSYFEMIGTYEPDPDFNSSDRDRFIRGACLVLPQIEELPFGSTRRFLHRLYTQARCGLYHHGMDRDGVGLGMHDHLIVFNEHGHMVINPHTLIPRLVEHFTEFVHRLKDPGNELLRKRFAEIFKEG